MEGNVRLISANVDSEISNGDVEGHLVVYARLREVFFREYNPKRLFHYRSANMRLAEQAVAEKEREKISKGRMIANHDGFGERSSRGAPAQISSCVEALPKQSNWLRGPRVGIQEDNNDDR
jgi:hypothetical protein